MSRLKKYIKIIAVFAIGIFASNTSQAQDIKKDKEKDQIALVQNLVNAKNYVFIAQYAIPSGGRNIFLTSTYDVRVTGDSLITDLPYYGRAYQAPIDPTEGGIHFTSTDFDYKVAARKKGGWDITIQPKDTRDVRQMLLTIYENGTAMLQVNSNSRQAISFNGYIKERKPVNTL